MFDRLDYVKEALVSDMKDTYADANAYLGEVTCIQQSLLNHEAHSINNVYKLTLSIPSKVYILNSKVDYMTGISKD